MKKSPVLGSVILLALAATAQAQGYQDPAARARAEEMKPLPTSLSSQDVDVSRDRSNDLDFGLNAAAHVRFSIPFGAANRDVSGISTPTGALLVIDNHLSWNELFSSGWGGDLELDIMLGSDRRGGNRQEGGMRYGIYFTMMVDEFNGSSAHDDFGNFVSPDNMTVNAYLLGGKVMQSFGKGFFAEGRMGLGAVHWSSVPATFGGPLTPDFQGELFRESWTFGMEIRGGGGIKLGPLGLTLGLGFRWFFPPSEGSVATLNSGPMWTFDIDLGAEIGF